MSYFLYINTKKIINLADNETAEIGKAFAKTAVTLKQPVVTHPLQNTKQ